MPSRAVLTFLLFGATVLLAGCGTRRGDGGPTTVDARGQDAPHARVIATLGDSIVAGSPHWDPDPGVRGSLASVDEDSQWQRWVDSDAELRNCGVWGERTDEIAARYADCTRGADAVVLQGGINDIAQGRSIDDAAHDLACLAERARGDGLDVALVEVLPWNNGGDAAARSIRALNRQVHALARRGDVPVLPFHSVLADHGDPDRMPGDRTVEGDHPNVAGYHELGEHAWREPRSPSGSFAADCPR